MRGQGRAQILKGWLLISEHPVLLDELKQAFKLVPDAVGPSQMNLKGLRESNSLGTEVAFEAFDVGVAVGNVMQEIRIVSKLLMCALKEVKKKCVTAF